MLCFFADTIRNEQGLHLAVASMRVGERAWVWVDAQYGWGAQGNFSFPTIPPNASLTYEIELIDYEPPSEDKSYREMTYEERLEASDRRRGEGNEAFKAGLYEDALKRYGAALSFIDEDMLMQLAGFHYDRAIAARIPALLNMAACHIQLGDHDSAVAVTSQVLSEDSRNVKALYRRGVAKHALGQTEAALKDLENALKHAPEDVSIKKELLAVRRSMQEERRAGATLFQGLLNKRPQSTRLTKDDGSESESEDEDEENEDDRKATRQSFVPTTTGWWMDFLQALCPFMFRKSDRHLHSS